MFAALAGLALLGAALYWFFLVPTRSANGAAAGPRPAGELNILIIGKDARAVGLVQAEGFRRNRREERSHSDIIIVCHLSYDKPSLNLVGIPRDLLVEVPGVTAAASSTDFARMEKITHVHAIGGERLLRRTVGHLLGIEIHRSIAFDFDSFRMTIGLLRPFLGALRIGGEVATDRHAALRLARRRHGLEFDDADRCRNAVTLVRTVIARTWRLARTRAGAGFISRVLAIVGEDTDLTAAEVGAIVEGLHRAGFRPARIQTAVLVAQGKDVMLARYGQVLSTYLPVYREIERQADRFLRDRDDVEALDFMTQQPFRVPAYFEADYATAPADSAPPPAALPFDTTGMDSARRATLLRELQRERPAAPRPDSGR